MFPGPTVNVIRLNNNNNDINNLDEGSAWEERQQRTRSILRLIMYLSMMSLMGGNSNTTRQKQQQYMQSKSSNEKEMEQLLVLNQTTTSAALISKKWRTQQLHRIQSAIQIHPRLFQLNKINAELFQKSSKDDLHIQDAVPSQQTNHYYYPNNATGHYKGYWMRIPTNTSNTTMSSSKHTTSFTTDLQVRHALQSINESIGVFLLPEGIVLRNPLSIDSKIIHDTDNFNSTTTDKNSSNNSVAAVVAHPLANFVPEFKRMDDEATIAATNATKNASQPQHLKTPKMHLTSDRGRIVMQLSLHTAPDMKGYLSWVDGYIQLFDHKEMLLSTAASSSATTRTPPVDFGVLTMKVKGFMVPQIGRISMIGNSIPGRSVFVIQGKKNNTTAVDKKRNDNDPNNQQEDDDILTPGNDTEDDDQGENVFLTHGIVAKEKSSAADNEKINHRKLQQHWHSEENWVVLFQAMLGLAKSRMSSVKDVIDPSHIWSQHYPPPPNNPWEKQLQNKNKHSVLLLDVHHDSDDEFTDHRQLKQESRADYDRMVSPLWLEKGTTINSSSGCEFEINLDMDPLLASNMDAHPNNNVEAATPQHVVSISGTIVSPNCNFRSRIETHAFRMNWASITTKAVNYSFTMMLLCLAQIVFLLRQLLHSSQSNSLASRVSMLTIGWQCILDAIWCMVHILFCLVMQPLFTAFASVAFFKLLLFCVIEMKYLQIIEQARLASTGHPVSADQMRRHAAIIQCRFYVGLISIVTLSFHLRQYWTFVIVLLHSWWVPQIIRNVITETKQPCHAHYIFGMSVTRLVAPIHMFGFEHNFIREMNPEFPHNTAVCYALLLWVGLQAVVLHLQGKWGARFMIPARFLPPRFDYSRPIPDSMLPPPPARQSTSIINTRSSDIEVGSSARDSGSRNRINKSNSSGHCNVTIIDNVPSFEDSGQTLDCVICYSSIDVHNRRGYMLPPCDHIFHRQCLEQWMEVKLECPICRNALPPT